MNSVRQQAVRQKPVSRAVVKESRRTGTAVGIDDATRRAGDSGLAWPRAVAPQLGPTRQLISRRARVRAPLPDGRRCWRRGGYNLDITVTLEPGTRLGSYEILSALGAGGMGEVYRARDTRLNRDVAIKVLPADVSARARRDRPVRA